MTIGRLRIANEEDYEFALGIVEKCMDDEEDGFRGKLLAALAAAVEKYEDAHLEGYVATRPVFDFYAEGIHQACGSPWHLNARGGIQITCNCSPALLFLEKNTERVVRELTDKAFAQIDLEALIPVAPDPGFLDTVVFTARARGMSEAEASVALDADHAGAHTCYKGHDCEAEGER